MSNFHRFVVFCQTSRPAEEAEMVSSAAGGDSLGFQKDFFEKKNGQKDFAKQRKLQFLLLPPETIYPKDPGMS